MQQSSTKLKKIEKKKHKPLTSLLREGEKRETMNIFISVMTESG